MIEGLPESIILDFDGVILDSSAVKTDAFMEFYSRFPKVFDEIKAFHLKNKGLSRYEQFKYLCKLLNIESSQNQINKFAREFSQIVMDKLKTCSFIHGAINFLEIFYQKIPLHVASNAPHGELLHIISEQNLGKYFYSINGSTEKDSKNTLLLEILKKYNYKNTKTLYIGDTLSDYNVADEIALNFFGIKNSLVKFPLGVISFENMEEVKTYLINLQAKNSDF